MKRYRFHIRMQIMKIYNLTFLLQKLETSSYKTHKIALIVFLLSAFHSNEVINFFLFPRKIFSPYDMFVLFIESEQWVYYLQNITTKPANRKSIPSKAIKKITFRAPFSSKNLCNKCSFPEILCENSIHTSWTTTATMETI